MTYNPYEPPQVDRIAEAAAARGGGAPLPWTVGDVLAVSGKALGSHWPVLVFAPMLATVVGAIPGMLPAVLLASRALSPQSIDYVIINAVCSLTNFALNFFFSVGLTKIYVAAARGDAPDFGDLFGGGPRVLPAMGAGILAGLGVFFGFLMFIVPGVIFMLAWSLATFFVVDAEQGPIEALRASWAATKGHRWNLLGFFLVSVLILLVGACAFLVGFFVAIPICMVAFATIYVRLSGRAEAAAG